MIDPNCCIWKKFGKTLFTYECEIAAEGGATSEAVAYPIGVVVDVVGFSQFVSSSFCCAFEFKTWCTDLIRLFSLFMIASSRSWQCDEGKMLCRVSM